MSTNPIQPFELTAALPAGVADLGLVRGERSAGVSDAAELLLTRLQTERNAGRALRAAIGELESRLNAERATSQALLAAVRDLDTAVEGERAEVRFQRATNGQLWSQVTDLQGALTLAERPLWRKLLRRA